MLALSVSAVSGTFGPLPFFVAPGIGGRTSAGGFAAAVLASAAAETALSLEAFAVVVVEVSVTTMVLSRSRLPSDAAFLASVPLARPQLSWPPSRSLGGRP